VSSEERTLSKATDTQRAAQRRVVGCVQMSGYLGRGGLALWREHDAGDWKASAGEIARDLDTLGVPSTTVTAMRPPTTRSPGIRKGLEVRVAFKDLPSLVRWMPSLATAIDGLPANGPGFNFAYYDPTPDGGALLRRAFIAAEWPSWTVTQAVRMGLVCPRCARDLRQGGADVPVNRPESPGGRRRLFCLPCYTAEEAER
jgi:hypothetical protein